MVTRPGKLPATPGQIETARDEYGSDDIRIDDYPHAAASVADDGSGTWVQAWVWVPFPDEDDDDDDDDEDEQEPK